MRYAQGGGLVVDLAADRLGDVARHALAHEDAWEGFAYYVEEVCELQATDPAVADVLSGRYPGAERPMALCSRAIEAAARNIEPARRAGALRPDFTGEDLALTLGTNGLLARAAAGAAPDTRRRGIAFLLDGLRTEAARRSPTVSPLAPQQVYGVMDRLTGTPERGQAPRAKRPSSTRAKPPPSRAKRPSPQ